MKSIMQEDRSCYICGTTGVLEQHHIYGGYNRPKSEKLGLKIYLCPECHRGQFGVHNDKGLMRWLREEGQRAFEKAHPTTSFKSVFGKNYLPEIRKMANGG